MLQKLVDENVFEEKHRYFFVTLCTCPLYCLKVLSFGRKKQVYSSNDTLSTKHLFLYPLCDVSLFGLLHVSQAVITCWLVINTMFRTPLATSLRQMHFSESLTFLKYMNTCAVISVKLSNVKC